ncbi:NAD(P)/FAD-dependent oxidoreductase [Humisphaera borealis]|uniref:NAD(P)/FAD-dependent oxidoreductase n=1 Tax=Humisphaera borealis TaxID=2807512 RepID=A0A7M2WYN6_9BACT|nr:NAD(P)/FAD-dependent oxidoreductase [Humisphaera borealis]QOV90474.1 NAD(P)/FAD-dependent oxidoreductase [Humisphaera borealis]
MNSIDRGSGDPVVVIGGGFSGLSAALELAKSGIPVTVLEADSTPAGLAGTFDVNGQRVEKFYHHWFTNDAHIIDLVNELGVTDQVIHRPTRTGLYFANTTFRLSRPLDVLKFKPLAMIDRIRLGLLVLKARKVKDWRQLEGVTAAEWLIQLAGPKVYEVVWEPLLKGKFGSVADEISAVWFWNKLKLRGGSRGKGGGEVLAYYRGGFAALADRMAERIIQLGGHVECNARVTGITSAGGAVTGVVAGDRVFPARAVIATPALPIIADLLKGHVAEAFSASLGKIRYLANICLVLGLDRSLSDTYWLNVNDPQFPYVGVIEHTNFEPAASYGGRHIVYLSKYLPEDAELYRMRDADVLAFSLPHLKRMFPKFDKSWVKEHHVWRARYAQPIVERHYGAMIPPAGTPLSGFHIATMAQVYPEDRGTNYAVREGRAIGRDVARSLGESPR